MHLQRCSKWMLMRWGLVKPDSFGFCWPGRKLVRKPYAVFELVPEKQTESSPYLYCGCGPSCSTIVYRDTQNRIRCQLQKTAAVFAGDLWVSARVF
jgi:hypothetical protein